jgi:hypothetical protein
LRRTLIVQDACARPPAGAMCDASGGFAALEKFQIAKTQFPVFGIGFLLFDFLSL